MKFEKIKKGIFVKRLNRFTATVEIDGTPERVHIKNTGRCNELFTSGTAVYLLESNKQSRKTKYDLITIDKNNSGVFVNVDSQIPNALVYDWIQTANIFSKNATVKKEVVYGKSRIDLYVEDGPRKAFIEVKGVTLEENGVALFPDAPTERGIKHLKELMKAIKEGYEAYIVFVIKMKGVNIFSPNTKSHEEFTSTLKAAKKSGVNIIALDCVVTPNEIVIDDYVFVKL